MAEELERQVQQLNEELQDGLMEPRTGGGGGEAMAPEVRKAMEELQDMAREQGAVLEETKELAAKEDKALKERFKKGFDKELDEIGRQVAEARRKVAALDSERLDDYDRDALKKAASGLERLQEAVEHREVPEAAEAARRLAGELDELGVEMKLSARKARRHSEQRSLKRSAGVCDKVGGQMAKVAERLESMMPDPESNLGKAGRRRARKLQRRQQALRKRLKKTREGLGQGPGMRGLKRHFQSGLEQIGESMRRAEERLGASRPGRARPHERSALEAMQKMSEEMKQAMQQRRKGKGDGGTGRDPNRTVVEIPGKEAFRAPRAFRELLMRTMKEKAGGRFKGALERYFQELAR